MSKKRTALEVVEFIIKTEGNNPNDAVRCLNRIKAYLKKREQQKARYRAKKGLT